MYGGGGCGCCGVRWSVLGSSRSGSPQCGGYRGGVRRSVLSHQAAHMMMLAQGTRHYCIDIVVDIVVDIDMGCVRYRGNRGCGDHIVIDIDMGGRGAGIMRPCRRILQQLGQGQGLCHTIVHMAIHTVTIDVTIDMSIHMSMRAVIDIVRHGRNRTPRCSRQRRQIPRTPTIVVPTRHRPQRRRAQTAALLGCLTRRCTAGGRYGIGHTITITNIRSSGLLYNLLQCGAQGSLCQMGMVEQHRGGCRVDCKGIRLWMMLVEGWDDCWT
mmetsp:Transcript_22147/g.33827  ORF Transcript_22147/g.33827 Transcript_22147/m.33827 type:complete len:268 (+) Transcript_22147:807-1610(+)